jgi:hypothetical protein
VADYGGHAALGRLPGISEDLLLGRRVHSRAQEGPGHGDLLPLPDREYHAALELMAVQGVLAIFNGASDTISAGTLCRADCG